MEAIIMKIREYKDFDFPIICKWVQDERIHYFWCAGKFHFPLTKDDFYEVLKVQNQEWNDEAYSIVDENGNLDGFFVCNVNLQDNSSFLKFVILNNDLRQKGYGKLMMQIISDYLVEEKKIAAIKLCVFDKNNAALHCYKNVGFVIEDIENNAFNYKDEIWSRCRMKKIINQSL